MTLRSNARVLEAFLPRTAPGEADPRCFRLLRPFDARYEIGPIEVSVDVRNGKIARLIARQGYLGSLFESVTVGARVALARTLCPSIYYDEAEELLLVRGVAGVALHVEGVDLPASEVERAPIAAISVFAPEAWDTIQGADGRW
jgi:hypothetical protein